jgi:hypothetical protein
MSAQEADVNFQAPVKSTSIENMVRMRAAVIDLLNTAVGLIEEADKVAAQAHVGFPTIQIRTSYRSETPIGASEAREVMRREIDRAAWSYLLGESGLRTFMDAKARQEFDRQLHDGKDVPELTADNVASTFGTLYASRGEMFDRGVIRCFKNLSWDYKTNKPFAFGKRIILNHLFTVWRGSTMTLRHEACDELDDLVRVFSVLDGKPEPDHRQGLQHQIHEAYKWGAGTDRLMHEYFELRWFLKGTGHLTFRRLDLVDKLNAILARYFPGALPAPR